MTHFNRDRFVAALQDKGETYTLREIADQTGVSAATLSRLERGTTPDLETFFAICTWLDVSPRVFMMQATTDDDGEPTYCATCRRLRAALAGIGQIVERNRNDNLR
jgi:transcriptional regulator with XRE-family HTH domain